MTDCTRSGAALPPSLVAPIGPTSPRALARVPFHGGELLAVAGPVDLEGDRPVPLRPFCERLGLDHSAQLAKLRGKPWATVAMITTVAGDGRSRELACLPLRALPMWLATINTRKVAPEARAMLEAYQLEAAEVLYRFFLAPPAPALPAAELTAQAQQARRDLGQLAWTMGLPERAPDPREPEGPAESVGALAADLAHIKRLLGFTPSGALPDGIIMPTVDWRSQTIMRLRAWLLEDARPLNDEEARARPGKRGISAAEAASAYNRWAQRRRCPPMSAGEIGRWLGDTAISGTRFRSPHARSYRYALALRDRGAALALAEGGAR